MYQKLKISHHRHSGHLLSHQSTSYLPLVLLLIIVGVLLVRFSDSALASPPPQSGSVSLTGTYPEQPPKVAATITVPYNQEVFSTSPITVSGTCPSGTLVEIYKNVIFAGSTPCSSNGTFSLSVDLLYGQNSLTAQVYDVLNQAGPLSSPISVTYNGSLPQAAGLSSLNFSGNQMLLETNAVYRGTFPGQVLNVPLTIIGGLAPFAVNVEWGDSSNSVIPRSDNSPFNASHTYQKAGTYQITVQATDSQQQVAFLTVAAIVNGRLSAISYSNVSNNVPKSSVKELLLLWPLYVSVITIVASFWFGEHREKRILGKANQQKPTLGVSPPTTT